MAVVTTDLSSVEFWMQPDELRDEAFAQLRRESPIAFFPEMTFEGSPMPPGPGYWALTRYADVWHVSRHPDLFQSGQGVNIPDMPIEIAEFFGVHVGGHFRCRPAVALQGFGFAGMARATRQRIAIVVERYCAAQGLEIAVVHIGRSARDVAQRRHLELAVFLRNEMKLTLSPEKTHVTSLTEGFEFLGRRVRLRWDDRWGYWPRIEIPTARVRDFHHRIKQYTTRGRSRCGWPAAA